MVALAALALLPALPFMSKYYLLLAFDCLLFGAMPMSLDVLMGYTGLVSFGHAAELLPGVAVDSPLKNYYLVLVFLALAYALCRVIVWSHFGRVLVAIRENEDRARFLGYRVQRYKMAACLISALLTGLAGALYPMRAAFATPDLMLWTESGEFIISVMIGGLGTLVGPILGGAFFTILRDKVSSFVDWYFIVIGVVLVLIVLFMPKGLLRWRQAA